ncbi:MAG: DUF2142 domain-containing protein [Solirubrobacteraceae bacterium]|nr:DUF2142 domain-containing protein [Solirubrobacteraceae bacterium]
MSRLFPGERRVWATGGGALAILLVVLLGYLLAPREAFTGSNSVSARDGVAIVESGQRLCVRRVSVPAGTGQVRVRLDTWGDPTPRVDLTVEPLGRPALHGSIEPSARTGLRDADIAIPVTPASPASVPATICLRPSGGKIIVLGRSQKQVNQLPLLLDGKRIDSRAALWFRPPVGQDERSIAAQLPQIAQRAALFRPRGVGPWTYWAILFVAFPLLAYGSLRLLARADAPWRRPRRLAAWVALLTFLHAGCWALVSPPFQTPDEPEHFVYMQYFAETGKAVDRSGDRPLYSSEEVLGLEATRMQSVIERPEAKMPWLARDEGTWRARHDAFRPPPPRDNGGGAHPAIWSHTPAYYALLAPGYYATRDFSVFTKLTVARLGNGVLAALIAALAALLVLELLPGRRSLAVAGGLFVGLLPMFGFMGAAINNDMGVNALAALVIYLVVRALRRGLSWPLAIGLGAALVAMPLMKATGYALYPPVALALLAYLLRRHRAGDLARLAGMAGAFAVAWAAWGQISPLFDRPVLTTPGGITPGTGFAAWQQPSGYLSWMWQTLVPIRLPFLQDQTIIKWPLYDIYVREGFASFGWYAIFFREWVYVVILAVCAMLIALGLRLLWQRRAALRERWPETLFIALVPVAVVFSVEAAFFTLGGWPLDGTPEQGRYGFTAITAVAAIAVAGCLGAGPRWALRLASGLVGALLALIVASWLLTLSSFYA